MKKMSNKKTTEKFKPRKIKIKIIGIGGGASSILREMSSKLRKVKFLLVDTDKRSFRNLPAKIKKFSFGEKETRGWGTGMNVDIAKKAILEVEEKINKEIEKTDLVILISCLGGGVGSGVSQVFSQVLRKKKIISLGIFTLPFGFEGEKKMKMAKKSLEEIKPNLSGTIILPNEKILKRSNKKTALKKALSSINQILIKYLKDLINLISLPGLINIDFADIRSILKGRDQIVCFGRGSASGSNRVEEAIKSLFKNPFFICPDKLKRILFNISSDKNLAIKEVEQIANEIFNLNSRARIIFGISQSPKKQNKIVINFLGIGNNISVKEKKKRKPKKKKKKKTKNKRRSALEAKKVKKNQEEELFGENDWEVPTFLRNKEK